MANHKSAVKRAVQNEKNRLRNKSIKTRIKNVTKSVQLIIKDKSGDEVATILTRAQSVIDNAAKKGVIHKNTAARKISRLYKLVNSNG
ncbi:MAG: 30S ribosomal protein S20 [Deltaproteobacteria bacterium]|nr:30S ribosomal protein S20 [Deltaproteobacteria bacterium]